MGGVEEDYWDEDESAPLGGFPGGRMGSGGDRNGEDSSGKKKKKGGGGFESFGLSRAVFSGIKRRGFKMPTPVQRKSIPLALAGKDLVVMARTGSGKTAAFVIPVLERLKEHESTFGVRAVLLAPTRELALQTCKVVKELGTFTGLRVAALVGGDSMEGQFESLTENPDIYVATPGRLLHILAEVDSISLRSVEMAVFDEADRLFEMGFAEQMRDIMTKLAPTRQTMLFSATLPAGLAEFARAGLREPEIVRLDADTKVSPELQMSFFMMRPQEKLGAILYLLQEVIPQEEQAIIFTATKHHAELLHILLSKKGHDAAVVYGAMDQAARRIHVAKFRSRKARILLVTDVASRGIDLPLLDNVINFHFPPKPKLFVHRVGRTARAGRSGSAYSLFTRDELPYAIDLHLFLSRPLKGASLDLSRQGEYNVKEESVYGRFPSTGMDEHIASGQLELDMSDELAELLKVATRAEKLYYRTRPKPSHESAQRAKAVKDVGVHPLLCTEESGLHDTMAKDMNTIKRKMTKWRPASKVFEDSVAPGRAVPGLDPGAAAETKRRRYNDDDEEEEEDIDEEENLDIREVRANAPQAVGKFRDDEFYISTRQRNHMLERAYSVNADMSGKLEDATLDLLPEDAEGVVKQRRLYHWDSRHKRYIQTQGDDAKLTRGGKKTRNSSGAFITEGTNTGIYKRWQSQTHKSISRSGDEEEFGTPGGGRRGGRGRGSGGRSTIPHANVKNELRTPQQIAKERMTRDGRAQRGRGGGGSRGRGGSSRGGRGGGSRGGKRGMERSDNERLGPKGNKSSRGGGRERGRGKAAKPARQFAGKRKR